MSFGLFLRLLWREARGARARLLFVLACLSVGVAAVVGVAALIDAVELGIRARSRELLGGDLAIESRAPLPELGPILQRELGKIPYRRVDMSVLSTMVSDDHGKSRLAELKALDTSRAAFPLAGKLELSPPRPLAELLDDHSVLVAPAILNEQGLSIGDHLSIGGQRLRIRHGQRRRLGAQHPRRRHRVHGRSLLGALLGATMPALVGRRVSGADPARALAACAVAGRAARLRARRGRVAGVQHARVDRRPAWWPAYCSRRLRRPSSRCWPWRSRAV
ncbi:MAG TPA: hypothetical protein VJV78_29350 [Polyangiales bacterium]|nr:hypothetical protein [Polyangiales bacterium]